MALFVDLTLPPYVVVPDDPSKALQNASGINAAIAAHSGQGAVLILPQGEIYCDRTDGAWSLRIGPGVSRVSLRGAGMFATVLVQEGEGVPEAEWDLLVLDSCSEIEVSHLGLRQGKIEHASPEDRNALVSVVAITQHCRNVVLEQVFFGPCIGDGLRVQGGGVDAACEQLRLTGFVMDTGGHAQGSGGHGAGSRTCVSLRGGARKLELGHGYLRGARLAQLETEPAGDAALEDLLLHHLVVDNTGGQSAAAISLAGTARSPLERAIVSDAIVLEGNVTGALTRDATLSNLTIRTSREAPAELEGKALLAWTQAHENTTISNLNLHRGAGSPAGPLVAVIPAGRAGGTIDVVPGLALVDGETFTISDGVTSTTFELDSDGRVARGHVAVPFSSRATALDVRDAIIAAINDDLDLQITASTSALPVQAHVVVLTNDHYGQHGNVGVASTVAHPAFLVAGMVGGVGESVDVKLTGGTWKSYVGPGAGKRYFEARGCRRVSVSGIDMQLGAVGANEHGFGFRSLGDIHAPSLVNVRIESVTPTFGFPGGKLVSAAYFAATNGGEITDIRVSDVRAPDACTTGVLLDRNNGASIDTSPVIQGCDFAGASNAWLALNDAIDEVFPIVAGNRGGRTWQVGTAEPGLLTSAVQGSRYTRQSGDGTTEWIKQSGTGSAGWALVGAGIERRTSDGAASLEKQVTFVSGHRTTVTLANHTTDGYIKHFVITAGSGDLAPTSLVDGTRHVITWQGPGSFSLIWDAAASAWRVLGTPRGALVT